MNVTPVPTEARSEVECEATTLAESWPGRMVERDDNSF